MLAEGVSRNVYDQPKEDGLHNKSYEEWKEELIAHGPYATAGDPERAMAMCASALGGLGEIYPTDGQKDMKEH